MTREKGNEMGLECALDSTLFVNVDTIEMTEFKLTTSTCTFFGNPFKQCEMESDVATVPWSVSIVSEEELEIPSGVVDIGLKNCFTTKFNATFSGVRLKRINWKWETVRPYVGFEFGPSPKFDTDSGAMTATVKGDLEFTGSNPEKETYEIV